MLALVLSQLWMSSKTNPLFAFCRGVGSFSYKMFQKCSVALKFQAKAYKLNHASRKGVING